MNQGGYTKRLALLLLAAVSLTSQNALAAGRMQSMMRNNMGFMMDPQAAAHLAKMEQAKTMTDFAKDFASSQTSLRERIRKAEGARKRDEIEQELEQVRKNLQETLGNYKEIQDDLIDLHKNISANTRRSAQRKNEIEEKTKAKDLLQERRGNLQSKEEELTAELNNASLSSGDLLKIKTQLKKSESASDKLRESALRLLETSSSIEGEVLARGIAGKAWSGGTVDSSIDGIKKGVYSLISHEFGKVLSDRIGRIFNETFGSTLDYLYHKTKGSFITLNNHLFHGGFEPFDQEELKEWQALIKEIFDDIERMVKDGLKNSLRGRDMALRQFDLGGDDNDGEFEDGKAKEEVEEKDAWFILILSYVAIFDKFVEQVDARNSHYVKSGKELSENGDLVVFFADRIKKLLLDFKGLLVNSESISDLDAAIKSNKAIITAIKRNINSLFKQLITKVKPPSYSLSAKNNGNGFGRNNSSRRKQTSNFWNDDDDDDYPTSFGNSYY